MGPYRLLLNPKIEDSHWSGDAIRNKYHFLILASGRDKIL